VAAKILDAEGTLVRNVQFSPLPNSGGEYRTIVKDLPRGKYRVTPEVAELAGEEIHADYPFEVRDIPTSEYVELALDDTELKAVSTAYRPFLQADELVAQIPKIELAEEHRQDFEVWDSFYLLGAVALLLALEWHWRRKMKLV